MKTMPDARKQRIDSYEEEKVGDISAPRDVKKRPTITQGHAVSSGQKLAMIEAAISRLDSGTFGLCLSCGFEIDMVKLEEDPTAAFCGCCREPS